MTEPAWGKPFPRMLRAEVVSAHPLGAPTWPSPICCCLALPGEEKTFPHRFPDITGCCSCASRHGELWVCSTQPSPPAEELWIYRGIRFIRKRRNYKYEPKQEHEASVGLNRNSKPCPLLWASVHSVLPSYLSALAAMESASCLLSIQTFLAEPEGILMLALVCINNTTVQSH